MFDIKWIRDNPAAFDAGLKKRGLAPLSVGILAMDEKRRSVLTALQAAQSLRKGRSNAFAKAKATNNEASLATLTAELAESKEIIAKGEAADRLDIPGGLDEYPICQRPNQREPFGAHRRQACIDVQC